MIREIEKEFFVKFNLQTKNKYIFTPFGVILDE